MKASDTLIYKKEKKRKSIELPCIVSIRYYLESAHDRSQTAWKDLLWLEGWIDAVCNERVVGIALWVIVEDERDGIG